MSRQENDITFDKLTCKELAGWCAKWGFYCLPFLITKSIDSIKATAANNSDTVRWGAHVIFVACYLGLMLG